MWAETSVTGAERDRAAARTRGKELQERRMEQRGPDRPVPAQTAPVRRRSSLHRFVWERLITVSLELQLRPHLSTENRFQASISLDVSLDPLRAHDSADIESVWIQQTYP